MGHNMIETESKCQNFKMESPMQQKSKRFGQGLMAYKTNRKHSLISKASDNRDIIKSSI